MIAEVGWAWRRGGVGWMGEHVRIAPRPRRVRMFCRRLAVVAFLVIAAQVPATMASAADRDVMLVGDVPTTAREVNPRGIECTDWATGRYAGLDLWRFAPAEGMGRLTRIDVDFLAADGSAYRRTVEGQDSIVTDA